MQDVDAVLSNLPSEGRERYDEAFETYVRTLALHVQRGSPLEVVLRAVVHALTAKTPRTRYPAGAPAGRMLTLYRMLRDRLLARVILRFLGLPRAFGARHEPPSKNVSHVGGLLTDVTGARSYDSIRLVLLDGMTYPADGSAKGEQRERSSHRQS